MLAAAAVNTCFPHICILLFSSILLFHSTVFFHFTEQINDDDDDDDDIFHPSETHPPVKNYSTLKFMLPAANATTGVPYTSSAVKNFTLQI